ncbi:MAG: 3-deoxy-manno-octulosonate cytidylyltransferase [Nitrospirota bacterium]
MKTLVVIPARYQSSRFLGKPLAMLNGKPMIWHVWSRATQIKQADKVIVATEDDKIAKMAASFGADVMMTAFTHKTGSDRVAEVAVKYLSDYVVNLQGDLPLFCPEAIDRLIQTGEKWIAEEQVHVVTLESKMILEEEIFSPNTVKIVHNQQGDILYFSRSVIPHIERGDDFNKSPFYKHYGVYLYHRDFLLKMAKSSEGHLERIERLEQLRVLEAGGRIRAVTIEEAESQSFCEVNTPEDLIKAEDLLR